jgi:hypothetical protein
VAEVYELLSPKLQCLNGNNVLAEEMFIASDYSAIFGEISKAAKAKANIRLSTKVVSVQTPATRSPLQPVVVTCQGGTRFEFDEVIMTTPLGWLQKNLDCFKPRLPSKLESAIQSLGISQLEKVYITFPSAFWISGSNSDSFPSYTNWLSPQYAPETNPKRWPQEIWNLASFSKPNSHPTILFYLYGDCSRHIVDSIHGKTKAEKDGFVSEFFYPYYSRLPGFDKNSPDCTPKAILASEWLKDDLNGNGSYCNFQVGIEAADKDVEAIRNGCIERRLWFCGEHAAPFEECGTVAGAYLSGESVGRKVVDLYGINEIVR